MCPQHLVPVWLVVGRYDDCPWDGLVLDQGWEGGGRGAAAAEQVATFGEMEMRVVFPFCFSFKKINVYLDLFVEIAALTWAIFWLPWKNKFFLEHLFFVS